MLTVKPLLLTALLLLSFLRLNSIIQAQTHSTPSPAWIIEEKNPYQFLNISLSNPIDLNDINHLELTGCIMPVEQMPEYPGGQKGMMNYFKNNLRYPPQAVKAKVQGTVFVGFVVEKDGTPSQIQILKGINYGCDQEACRLIAAMPKWKPGVQSGKPVAVKYSLPVKFTLPKPTRK